MQHIIQSLDIYLFALILLGLISFKVFNSPNSKTPQSRFFSALIILSFLIIIADSITVLLDGQRGIFIKILLTVASVSGYSLQVLICLFWYWYARTVLFIDRKSSLPTILLQALPAFVCICVAISSSWTSWLFSIDQNNYYRRGPLFFLVIIISAIYLSYGYFLVIKYQKNLDTRKRVALLCFAVPPIVAGIIQTAIYGVTLIWPSLSISFLIIYLAIQNELLLLDDLTGLNNRRSFDFALQRKIANAKHYSPFALMLIDIDNFRSINDRYGHMEGDKLLHSISHILETCFHKNGFIARYGADEFAIILEIQKLSDLDNIKIEFWSAIDEWNETSKNPWRISVSMGCTPYVLSEKLSQDTFFMKADKLLCLDKIVPAQPRFKYGRRR